MVGVHKRNVSPQNHSHDITLNDHFVYLFIILVNLFFHLIFIFFVIFCDLDDLNMSLNVFEHVLRMFPTVQFH
jgi:hypothetical protein